MIDKIVLHNWMPFKGTQTIKVNDSGITHIVGTYVRNEHESNRSGKSSILQAIYFCLYGRVQTTSIHTDADDMYVKLILNDGTILQKGTDGVWINGEKSTAQILTAYVERLLNMDDKMFLYTHCILNGDIKGLFNLTPKDQKNLLMNMSEFKYDWQSLYDTSKENLTAITNQLKGYLTKIEYLDEKLALINISDVKSKLETTLVELKARKDELDEFNKQESNIFAQISELKVEIQKLKGQIDNVNNMKKQQEEYRQKKESLTAQYKEREDKLKQYKSITAINNNLNKVNEELSQITMRSKILTNQTLKIKSSKGNCPLMNITCPASDLLEKQQVEWEKELNSVTELESKLKPKKEQLENEKQIVTKLEQEMHSIQQSFYVLGNEPEPLEDVSVYENKIKEHEETLKQLQGAFDSAFKEKLINDVLNLDNRSKVLQSTIKSYEEYAEEKKTFDELASALEDKKKIVAVATKLLSPHGLPYYLSAKVLSDLEIYTNEFLEFMETSIYISPYKQLNTLEEYCIIDGYKYKGNEEKCAICGATREKKIDTQITIYSADRGLPLDLESTGGKAIYYLALRFGLMKLLKSKGKILILDEIFANLDDTNKERLMEMIEYASQILEIEQIFVVSNDELKNILPVDISVVRHSDYSSIKQ